MLERINPGLTLKDSSAGGDLDPTETAEWLDALESVFRLAGGERAEFLLSALDRKAKDLGVVPDVLPFGPYRNTIPLEKQGAFPGDIDMETRITAIIRWNALAMVVRANAAHGELGGHVASYASAAEIFEVGFNHFFRGADGEQCGDVVFFQPHSAPGVYARAFLEGRLTEGQLEHYRQEITGPGLSSYPHPWLMPDFWQTPTGSMGIGPISAVYQARFMRYLRDRGLLDTDGRRVWGVFGDGEMDEPELTAGLSLAAREKLDNLTFIINCNLQRLDGPVRGNGQIIQDLEMTFRGAGWHVIKVLWGSEWDALFARDVNHALLRRFAATVDGKYQTLGARDGAYNLAHFFEEDPEVLALVADMSPEEIDGLKRGGHDFRKLFAAFHAAKSTRGRPTVILAKTKKGFGMGGAFLGSGATRDVALALTKSGGFEERLRKRTRTHACVAHDLEEAMPHTKIGGGKLRRGEVKELLHGVPIEVKDLCWTSNRRHGIYKDYMPPEDYKDYMPSEDGRGPKIRCAVILAGLHDDRRRVRGPPSGHHGATPPVGRNSMGRRVVAGVERPDRSGTLKYAVPSGGMPH